MKPPPFCYHDPRSISDAVELLGRLDNAKLLAGGQSLMPMLNMRFVQPDHVIDLNRVEGLSYIREIDGALEIGGMTRQRDLEFSEVVRRRCPLMATPAIEPNELVTAVRFPIWPQGHGSAFIEFARRHGDFAIVSAAVLLAQDGAGRIARAAVALGGMGMVPIRAAELEQALVGQAVDDKLLREVCESCRKFDAIDDVHAPASYRQHLATVLSRRALEQASARLPSRAVTARAQ